MKSESPTILLIASCYVGFACLTAWAGETGGPLFILGLAVILTLYSSLQHEVIHGHPFRSQSLNDILVFPAFGLFVPYLRFKDTHLAHHHDPNLTDPYEDPETNFLDLAVWNKLPIWQRGLHMLNASLLGRIVLGPAMSLMAFYGSDLRQILSGNRRILKSYLYHVLGVTPCVIWIVAFTNFQLWKYVLACYLAMSILKIRTYLEHRAHTRAAARSVIIEDRGPLAFLFLNNNYHAVHHAHPKVVWHKLPALFDRKRDRFLAMNDSYSYPSYVDVIRKHLVQPKDGPVHPLWSSDPMLLNAQVARDQNE